MRRQGALTLVKSKHWCVLSGCALVSSQRTAYNMLRTHPMTHTYASYDAYIRTGGCIRNPEYASEAVKSPVEGVPDHVILAGGAAFPFAPSPVNCNPSGDATAPPTTAKPSRLDRNCHSVAVVAVPRRTMSWSLVAMVPPERRP